MSSFKSSEIRWMFDGELNRGVESWFKDGEFEPSIQERKDQYLIFPGMKFVGIKLRESKLEFKPLIQSNVVTLPELGSGKVELWEKWSIEKSAAGDFLHSFAGTDPHHWISVYKKRMLRKYSCVGDVVKEIDVSKRPAEGCGIEITELKIPNPLNHVGNDQVKYWTFGFEAFGNDENTATILDKTVKEFFHNNLLEKLDDFSLLVKDSMSYPEFLFNLLEETR